jgi:uncharacterized protein (UPF0333 family)
MEKRVKVLSFTILAIVIILGILQFFPQTRSNLSNRATSLAINKNAEVIQVSEESIDSILANITDYINKEPRYTDFIRDSKYHSVGLIIAKKAYYFEYNAEQGKVMQSEERETDFTVKINKKKLNKIMGLYEGKSYHEAAMHLIGELPRKVKINLFKQCMSTDWCKQFNF